MRLLLAFLPALLAVAAHAQAPRALNAPPLPSAEAEWLASFRALLGRSGPTPDTTAPWRYYPLHVGNAWEYATFDGRTVYRREINRDTTVNGRRYAIVEHYVAHDGGPLEPDDVHIRRYRFDSLSTLVYEPFVDGSGMERVPWRAPCPFDADFNTTVECPGFGDRDFSVIGGYSGYLIFGGTSPGTGEDTVSTAWKEYTWDAEVWTFAADFGEVYHESEVGAPYGLYFARVDGVEYGVEQYPVSAEPPPQGRPELGLRVWPNPAHGQATVSFVLERPEEVVVAVYDVLGRCVAVLHEGVLAAGRHELPVEAGRLPAGVYVVRVVARAGAGAPAVRRITITR